MGFKGSRLSDLQVLWCLAHVGIRAVSQKGTDEMLSGTRLCCICFHDGDLILNYFDKLEIQQIFFPSNLESQADKWTCLDCLPFNTYSPQISSGVRPGD